MDTSNDVTLTIFGSQTDKVIQGIKPDNVELDAITGNTYINLQPVTNEPGWKRYKPDLQMPATFTPQHNTTQLQPHWVERMDFSWGPPSFVGPNPGHTEQPNDPFLPSGSKRTIPRAGKNSLPNIEELAMGLPVHQMPMAQQQIGSVSTPTPPPRTSGPRPRRPVQAANILSTTPKVTKDASTDARDIHEHMASLRKANMILQCCPDILVDDGGMKPPQEDPQLYYLLIKNLRNSSPATRELVQLHVQKTANFAHLEFVKVQERNYSAFVGFRTIQHAKAVAKAMPPQLALRDIIVCLADSRYILTADWMFDLMRFWTQRGHNGVPLHCIED